MWGILLLGGMLWLLAGLAAGQAGRLPWMNRKWSTLLVALLGPITAGSLVLQAYGEGNSATGPLIDKTRIVLIGLSVKVRPGDAVTIGADAGTNDLLVAGAPARLLSIGSRTGRGLEVALLPQEALGGRAAVVMIDGQPLGAAPAEGAEPCSQACDDPGSTRQSPESRRAVLYAPEGVFGGDARARFFFSIAGRMFAQRGGGAGQPIVVPLRDGAQISIWTATAPDRARGQTRARLLIEQQFVVRHRDAWIEIGLERPGVTLASPGTIRLVAADAGRLPRARGNVVLMPMLGAPFGSLLNRIDLNPGITADQTYVGGIASGTQRNDHVELDNGARKVLLRVEPLTLASGLRLYVKWLVLLFLAASAALTWQLRRDRPVAAMLLATAEMLLTLRILVSVEGGMVEGTDRAIEALPAALVALPLGVLAVTVALAPGRPAIRPAIGFAIMAGLALWLIGKTTGPISGGVWEVVGILIGIVMAAFLVSRFVRPVARGSALLGDPILRRIAPVGPLRFIASRDGLGILVGFTLLSAGLLLAGRLLLLGAGLREAVFFGGTRLALSIAFMPLTLVAAAPVLARLSRARSAGETWVCLASFILYCGIGVLLPNIWAGDEGVALVLSVALTLAVAAALLASAALVTREAWLGAIALGLVGGCLAMIWANESYAGWMGLLSIAALLGALALALAYRKRTWSSSLAATLGLTPLAFVASILLMIAWVAQMPIQPQVDPVAATASRDWQTRLRAVLAPNRFAQLITDDAVNLRTTMAHLHDYGATADGRDFLNLPLVTQLKNQQFSDYGAAIHLISPFGRLGAAGLILMFGGLATMAFGIAARRRRAIAWSGALAIAGLTTASTYIILANALAAPLTGRNVYLLAITSNADLIEGLTLLVIGAATLCRRPVS